LADTPILFAGDPHGNFAWILRGCSTLPAATLIQLCDCDCPAPLDQVLAPAIARGWDVHWILGKHVPGRRSSVHYRKPQFG
jgi:hypothetical protein